MNSPICEIRHAANTARFSRTPHGWQPDWFYTGTRPMLRFKDHEWLSLGHVHPTVATDCEALPGDGARFRGRDDYGGATVDWTVTVQPDPLSDGFIIECAFTPAASIELMEAYSTFETPYEYDGQEHVTTIIGQNPVNVWQGDRQLSPPIWQNPAWIYARTEAARITGPAHTPYLHQTIHNPDGSNARSITVIGDWNVCQNRDLFATPTRVIDGKRGYKYIVGALNWSSAFAKDPNVLYRAGATYRQRVIVLFGDVTGHLDDRLLTAYTRTAALSFPADGAVPAADRVRHRGVTWQAANEWLRDAFVTDRVPALFTRQHGLSTYTAGTRPKHSPHGEWMWWSQWMGGLHYRARVRRDTELETALAEIDQIYLARLGQIQPLGYGAAQMIGVGFLPLLRWLTRKSGDLAAALAPNLRQALAHSVSENGKPRQADAGAQAAMAEGLFLSASIYNDPAFAEQALVLVTEFNRHLDGAFWDFNTGLGGKLSSVSGQIRSLGHGHAIAANLLAFQHTGDPAHLKAAHRFARYLLSICYTAHNSSRDPDFDWRGWCCGSNAGRDQLAEFPPWETTNGLLCLVALMAELELEPAFYDVLWYFSRTGLAQFPAARTLKKLTTEDGTVVYKPRRDIKSEQRFYDSLPYLAYENPFDQTMLAPYQGSDCLLGELVFGGGLVTVDDDRVLALVPQAALLDLEVTRQCDVHLWNPLAVPIQSHLRWTIPGAPSNPVPVELPPRQVVRLRMPGN